MCSPTKERPEKPSPAIRIKILRKLMVAVDLEADFFDRLPLQPPSSCSNNDGNDNSDSDEEEVELPLFRKLHEVCTYLGVSVHGVPANLLETSPALALAHLDDDFDTEILLRLSEAVRDAVVDLTQQPQDFEAELRMLDGCISTLMSVFREEMDTIEERGETGPVHGNTHSGGNR